MATTQGGEITDRLPNYFHPGRGGRIPDGLVGATIVRMGTFTEQGKVEGGGLVIDYRPPDSREVRRAVFAFNELGMWLADPA